MKAPFPYFGGKSKVSHVIWSALGSDVKNYVEPFAGSLATLLLRPGGAGKIETVNDYDGLLANAWRAMKYDPDGVAEHADNPVNECDLHARHLWLVGQRESITDRLMADPEFYDARAAGWWIWGACAWIGSGWCSGNGPWVAVDGVLTDRRKIPHLTGFGQGINRKIPHLTGFGQGINRQIPHLGGSGRGINRASRNAVGNRSQYIKDEFSKLAARLRDVRVACGDFERVLSPAVTTRNGLTGVFLDPPYDAGNDDPYHTSSSGVSARAREWAINNGGNPLLRIVMAGYAGEHDGSEFNRLGWRCVTWKAHGGYGNQANSRGRENANREVLWLSPGCLRFEESAGPEKLVAESTSRHQFGIFNSE